MKTIENWTRIEMKKHNKTFDKVNFVQDGHMRYQWGQFTKRASKIEFTDVSELNDNITIIGRNWYMTLKNGEWVYHDTPIAEEMMNPSAAKKTRHGKNPFRVLKTDIPPVLEKVNKPLKPKIEKTK